MENEIRRDFDKIIKTAENTFENVEIEQDFSVRRALLKIRGSFGTLNVRITEVIDDDKRKYAYYVLKKDSVVMGLDNAPDIKALKIKYGKDFVYYLNERIPYFHGEEKKRTELTKGIGFNEFLEKIKSMIKT